MKRIRVMTAATLVAAASLAAAPAVAQPGGGQAMMWSTDDPVLQQIWNEAMENSQLERLGMQLLDSIGPRLTGSPGINRAHDWAMRTLQGWGYEARNEPYGTWRAWDRGHTHIDLVAPRLRSLEGTMLAWSPGTGGQDVEGPVIVVPEWETEADFERWLATEVAGKFVAISFPQPTCRPNRHFEEFGSTGALARLNDARAEALAAFRQRVPAPGLLRGQLEEAGALGILESNWSNTSGTNKVFSTNTREIPTLDLSCEDYGLVYRLAEHDMGPVVRVNATSEDLGEQPVFNTIGMIRGSELPDEYVMLSAHFDSWDAGSGATDNGTGSILMLETMRILSETYPNPRRSILIGLWGGEEQGLNGSRRFVAMNPDIVNNLQVLMNQDNGTGRVENISMQGFIDAGGHWGRWLARIPPQITNQIRLQTPGSPGTGGTDHAAFVCVPAPAFNLSANSWGYGTYTWHTNRDTFDKLVFEDLRNNAALVAMLAYQASEDPERVSTAQRLLRSPQTGEVASWPTCQPGRTSSSN
jgi:carboxypeptidase Q